MTRLRLLPAVLILACLSACRPAASTAAGMSASPTPAASLPPAVPTLTPTASPTPQPRFPPRPSGPEREDFPPGLNPLTGLAVQDPAALDQPAVLISISNMPVTARPQAEPGFAPWIFELFIGEGTTRFMGVFYGDFPRRVPDIHGPCPVNTAIFRPQEGPWLGSRVWLDENASGTRDPWELGVGGVCVELYAAGGTAPLRRTATTSNGAFAFEVEAGREYFLRFEPGPAYTFTAPHVGDDDRDSDADPASGRTPLFTPSAPGPSWDAGLLLTNPPQKAPTPIPEDIAPARTYVGPIRSGRLTYNDFYLMFPRSCLVFASAAEDIFERLEPCEVVYGARNAATPNTALLDVSRMRELAAGRALPGRPVNYSGNRFDPLPPPGGAPAASLWTFYHSYTQASWQYDPVLGQYLRFLDDADGKGRFHPHTERLTGRQLAFENVILVLAEYKIFRPMQYDIDLNPGQQGFAWLFRDGQAYPIRWSAVSRPWEQQTGLLRPLHFTAADGTPFPLKPGRTWISLLTPASTLQDLGGGQWKAAFAQPE